MKASLSRRLFAEFIGTLFLIAAVVGSGIMGERLAPGNTAFILLVNSLATGMVLVAIIFAFGPISGAHLNPAITLSEAWLGELKWSDAPAYIAAQLSGAFAGVGIAHLMFGLHVFTASSHLRRGSGQLLSEFIATFGLMAVIRACGSTHPAAIPFAVAAYITSAYWFTASTSFANPAITIARSATNTFAGIRPADVAAFVSVQLAGALSAALLFRWLTPAAGREPSL